MRNWYTADSHFGADSQVILKRENRPFKNMTEYTDEQVRIWNEQASSDDVIYALGDFCNYNSFEKDFKSGLAVSSRINAGVILIVGNQEERVIRSHFGGEFEKFREYCLSEPSFKFRDILKNAYTEIRGRRYFLTHDPVDHDRQCLNLFGHTHRAGGLYRPYGFNVGVDLNHFRLFGDEDILMLLEQKTEFNDSDPSLNCW
ncbi:MAG: hypothetical protein K5869_00515 [Saccharofermentans sp.]|nr:hypothetical protein [Saccharofermentans sp.]